MRKNESELNRATIMFVAKRLPQVGADAMRFLENPFNFTLAFRRTGKRAREQELMWCGDCGGSFSKKELQLRENPKYDRKNYFGENRHYLAYCPHCGKEMQLLNADYRKRRLEDVVGIHATLGEWKIDRYFTSTCYCEVGKQVDIHVKEIGQTWTKDGKSYHYCARIGGMFYSKYWKTYEPWHLATYAPECETWWDGTERYEMPSDFSLDNELAKRGIALDQLHGLKLSQILQYMIEDSHFETLWKQGDWEIAKFFKKELAYYWPQVRIARKNGYKIEDLTEWRDYICLIRRHNKDDHNPKYICPANLHEAHQAELTEAERQDRIRAERARREMDERNRLAALEAMKEREKQEEDFAKRRAKYFGICIPFGDGNSIVVLQSIKEFEKEGNTLNHCVFRCGYYLRPNSLILSARDKDGNPIETIEVDLQSFKILQCYGYGDTFTPMHKTIVSTMNKNMGLIKELRRAS